MENLQLHDSGEEDYLGVLNEKYETRFSEINSDVNLSDDQKRIMLETAKKEFEQEKKSILRSLF